MTTSTTPYSPRGLVGVDVPVHHPITLEVILEPKFEDRQRWNQHLQQINHIPQESPVPVVESSFENWYAIHGNGDPSNKSQVRAAYAAGMCDKQASNVAETMALWRATAILVNAATVGITSHYEDGSPTPNQVLCETSARALHQLISPEKFDEFWRVQLDRSHADNTSPILGTPDPTATTTEPVQWYETVAETAAIYGEMCAINETERKKQSPEQAERLVELRAECVALHYKRIALAQTKQMPMTAVK